LKGRRDLLLAWSAVVVLTGVMMWLNVEQSLRRYRALESGWSWDLAYYNQWFWSLTQSDGRLTVRPQSAFGGEGETVWLSNYLAPIRFVIAPFYALRPGPEALLIIEAVFFWMVVPAAFVLALGESRSPWIALCAACLVPLTPLFLPLAADDFRELQLALPFTPLALEGMRGRRRWLAGVGIAGLLACRQEFALLVAMLGLVPPRRPEDLGRTFRWARTTWLIGIGWMLIFLAYLSYTRSPLSAADYLLQFGGGGVPLHESLATLGELLFLGTGAWGLFILVVPRAALLVFPWAWSLASGRWAIRLLDGGSWHHVRYAAPFVAIAVAAGVLGFARLMAALDTNRFGRRSFLVQIALLAAASLGMIEAGSTVRFLFASVPRRFEPAEAREIWSWIDRAGPDDGVLAHYLVTAPLSSRKNLRSYVLKSDQARGFPELTEDVHWVFECRTDEIPADWTARGFRTVFRGDTIWVYHRESGGGPPMPVGRSRKSYRPWFQPVEDPQRFLFAACILIPVGFGWWSLRRRWTRASSLPTGFGSRENAESIPKVDVPFEIVNTVPLDQADPGRCIVRLSATTAAARDVASLTLAAFEAAHLRIALENTAPGRVARVRPALTILARLGTVAALLAIATGLATGCRLVLDLGLAGFAAAAALPLLCLPIEIKVVKRARREGTEVDVDLMSALRWRHVAEALPIPWRPSTTAPRPAPCPVDSTARPAEGQGSGVFDVAEK
jgi:hypothetical protein